MIEDISQSNQGFEIEDRRAKSSLGENSVTRLRTKIAGA